MSEALFPKQTMLKLRRYLSKEAARKIGLRGEVSSVTENCYKGYGAYDWNQPIEKPLPPPPTPWRHPPWFAALLGLSWNLAKWVVYTGGILYWIQQVNASNLW